MNAHDLFRSSLSKPVPAFLINAAALAVVYLHLASGRPGHTLAGAALLGAAGVGAWTFFEYAFHRWLMHARIRALWKLLHQEHHAMKHMTDAGHRVMHPLFASAVLFGISWLIVRAAGAPPAVAVGFWLGYLLFEGVHWAHHDPRLAGFAARNPYLRRRGRFHVDHHFRHARKNYGFVTSFWDRVFGTRLVPAPRPGSALE